LVNKLEIEKKANRIYSLQGAYPRRTKKENKQNEPEDRNEKKWGGQTWLHGGNLKVGDLLRQDIIKYDKSVSKPSREMEEKHSKESK